MSNLIEALTFVSAIQKKSGTLSERFCRIENGYVYTNNGILSMGHPIQTDLTVCVDLFAFLEALKFCRSQEFSIVQLDKNHIATVGDGFRYVIETVDLNEIPLPTGIPGTDQINDSLIDCFKYMHPFVDEKNDDVLLKSIYLASDVCAVCANEKSTLVEGWHGAKFSFKGGIVIPGEFAKAVSKLKGELQAVGTTENALTIWTARNGFIKTYLYDYKYPEYQTKALGDFPPLSDLVTTPADFWPAIKSQAFSKNSTVTRFGKGIVQNSVYSDTASFYNVPWLDTDISFNTKYLLKLEKVLNAVKFNEKESKLYFTNGRVRGIILGLKLAEKKANTLQAVDDINDDIPF